MSQRWRDETSYSRDDKERIPSVWAWRTKSMRVCVHRYLSLPGWYLSVSGGHISMTRHNLQTEDLGVAKEKALMTVVIQLRQLVTELEMNQ